MNQVVGRVRDAAGVAAEKAGAAGKGVFGVLSRPFIALPLALLLGAFTGAKVRDRQMSRY